MRNRKCKKCGGVRVAADDFKVVSGPVHWDNEPGYLTVEQLVVEQGGTKIDIDQVYAGTGSDDGYYVTIGGKTYSWSQHDMYKDVTEEGWEDALVDAPAMHAVGEDFGFLADILSEELKAAGVDPKAFANNLRGLREKLKDTYLP